MLLSFSVDAMRPMIEAGLRQRRGEDVGGARVKRQTIRATKVRGKIILQAAKANRWRCPYELHLWWKSRTAERAFFGIASGDDVLSLPIFIGHSPMIDGGVEVCLGAEDGAMDIKVGLPGETSGPVTDFARADGFEGIDDFREFFVPKRCSVFEGVLFTW
jgi:hypothetical protein